MSIPTDCRAALEVIAQYGSDTLSGREDGPDDRAWQREAVAEMTRLARAALVVPQQGAPLPVPVSERPILKSSNFNDAKGRCWCGTKAFVDESGDLPVDYAMSWELREPCAQDDCVIPHWALPLPEVQA